MRGYNFKKTFLIVAMVVFIMTALQVGYSRVFSAIEITGRHDSNIGQSFAMHELESQGGITNLKFASCFVPDKLNLPDQKKGQISLFLGGQSIGVKLDIDGIFVAGFSDIDTKFGKKQSPALVCGVKIGDCVIEAAGKKLASSRQLSWIIGNSKGEQINLKIRRGKKFVDLKVKPVASHSDNQYRAGIWVRDSTAGVGTLTFVNPRTSEFGALGHPINDIDTGLLIPVRNGSIYHSRIVSVEQSTKGKPGEMRGKFSGEDEIGMILNNTEEGIYGKMNKEYVKPPQNMLLTTAEKSKVHEGSATILTSLDGISVKSYTISIEKCLKQEKPGPKSMIIRVTDKELLKQTGGIVQGMSGSPIIQDKKLIGAVTHVFVNKPTMGYGIYIDWMLSNLNKN